MARFKEGARTQADEGSRPGARGDGRARAQRTRIGDLAEVGYELTEQHLQMVSGGMKPLGQACSCTACDDVDCD